MTSWSSGYVTDITYTHGFYRELTPNILGFAALLQGKKNASAIKTYCELGCGHGLSMNLLAAANPEIAFHATDFNPEQIAGARALAEEAGTPNVTFYDTAFADFADEPNLPAEGFDVIALHGIYTWINAENRKSIVDFISRHLKVGGIVYISYNCHPGWSSGAPLQRLLSDHAATVSGSSLQRMDAAVAFAEKLGKVAGFFKANPSVAKRLDGIKGNDRVYLAHEYLNRNWDLFYFADVARDMERAKLSFLGSAAILENVDIVNLTKEQREFLATENDPARYQSLRDFMVNQNFRRDIFVKGQLPHTALSVRDTWLDTRFILMFPREKIEMKIKTPQGEVSLKEEIYGPILDALADGPRTLREMVEGPAIAGLGWARVTQALSILVGANHVQPALPAKDENARKKRTRAFNAAICERAKGSATVQFLASPVTGGAIQAGRFDQLFLAAHLNKQKDPAPDIWAALKTQGQRMTRDGKPLETEEENLAEIRRRHAVFTEKGLPVLVALGVA